MVHLIWFHGWGFDHKCFTSLIPHLPEFTHYFVDQGYFGPCHIPELSLSEPCIAIGHSLGFAQSLKSSLPFKGYISLCGFYQFCQTPSWSAGIPVKVIQRMITKFRTDPERVLKDFYKQCDVMLSLPPLFTYDTLKDDLETLLTLELTLPSLLLGAIAGEQDQITPLSMQQSLFKDLIIIPKSGHLPWVEHAPMCAHYIRQWCHNLKNE